MYNQIICICGKKKSGKDTLANSLKNMMGPQRDCKIFHFVDELKETSVKLFNLNRKNLYGTDDQKNEFTHYTWANWGKIFKSDPPSKNKFMTYTIGNVIQYSKLFLPEYKQIKWIIIDTI